MGERKEMDTEQVVKTKENGQLTQQIILIESECCLVTPGKKNRRCVCDSFYTYVLFATLTQIYGDNIFERRVN